MSGTTSTWVGGIDHDWNTATNWTNGVPNSATAQAVVNFDDGAHDAVISGGASVTVASLSIGDPNPPVAGLDGGHVIVGGSPDIGGGGGGTLTSIGTISVPSTNPGGGLVGGLATTITAPVMTVGAGATIGGGGLFNVGTVVNAGRIQADGGFFGLGTLVMTGGTISGAGTIEVDGTSGLELGSATAEQIAVIVAPTETATIILDNPASFTGALNLVNANSHVNLFFKNQTPTGATFDAGSQSLIITGASGTIDTIPFASNGTVSFSTPTSTLAGFGEVSIGPATGGDTTALPPANLILASDSTPGDNITNVALPTVKGTGEEGAVVTLRDGTVAIGTGTVTGGVWSITATAPLNNGANVLTATQTDIAGNISAASPTWTVTLNPAAPNGGAQSSADMSAQIPLQQESGAVIAWHRTGTSTVESSLIGNPGPTWHVKGIGEFNGDGNSDLLYQNDDGSVATWNLNGTSIVNAGLIGSNPGTTWHVIGTNDFNRDGGSDILFQNDDGKVAVWNVEGTSVIGASLIGSNPGTTWHVKGSGDFSGSGGTDILFQNDSGAVAIWNVDGTAIVGAGLVGANPGPTWHIKGTGDFNGDHTTDILFQNDDGNVAVWNLDGTSVIGASLIGSNPGPTWHVKGAADLNGDGETDILFQNDNGSAAVWDLAGTSVAGASLAGSNPGPSWHVIGTDRMNFIDGSTGTAPLAATSQPDDFNFRSFAAGAHTIGGFNPSQDVVEFRKSLFADFTALQSHTTTVGSDSLIDLGGGSSLTMQGVLPTALHSTDFVFV